ncbi:MAG: glutaminyl-peptide cyclotransferase [Culturomica sp.]|jgi:glutamine cyclotransferase|nr:glutaminyl-peptide cyclotransferase [Culturomica sp.]
MSGKLNRTRPVAGCLLCALLLVACGNGKPKQAQNSALPVAEVKQVKSLRITAPEKNSRAVFHRPLEIAFENSEGLPVDSARFYLNGVLLRTTGKEESRCTVTVPETTVGNGALRIQVFHPGDRESVASQPVLVVPDKAPVRYGYEVVRKFPHDPKAYTQGLFYLDGYLYESTGQYGESGIRKMELGSGKVLSSLSIDSKLFGEGIAVLHGKIYQLTWTSGKGFVYDLKTFSPESTFTYQMQGWGLATYNDGLILSDGSYRLYHINPAGFTVTGATEVCDHNGPVSNLNELEVIDGLVWANVWMTERIVLIDPESGVVKADLDLSGLLTATERRRLDTSDDVLNGIARNPETGTVYVTGKRWPYLFEIKVNTR